MSFLRLLGFNLRYLHRPPWDSGISPPELLEFIRTHPPGRAIDIGCGTGTNVITLAKAGWQTSGFDFAPCAIRIARQKARRAGIPAELFTDDAAKMKKVAGQFDLALDMGCFHSITQKEGYLAGLDRILAPTGSWLMYGFFKPDPHLSGPGFVAADLDTIQAHGMILRSRSDGFDMGNRPSAWLLFQKE